MMQSSSAPAPLTTSMTSWNVHSVVQSFTRTVRILSPQPPSFSAATMFLRAPGLASGAHASSRSRNTWSAPSPLAFSRNRGLLPGTARLERRDRSSATVALFVQTTAASATGGERGRDRYARPDLIMGGRSARNRHDPEPRTYTHPHRRAETGDGSQARPLVGWDTSMNWLTDLPPALAAAVVSAVVSLVVALSTSLLAPSVKYGFDRRLER